MLQLSGLIIEAPNGKSVTLDIPYIYNQASSGSVPAYEHYLKYISISTTSITPSGAFTGYFKYTSGSSSPNMALNSDSIKIFKVIGYVN